VEISAASIAIAGGLVPALVWLYFLLKEDSRCPEPRPMIALAFLVGMAAVPLVLFPEEFAQSLFAPGLPLVAVLAAIEELTKYILAALIILWQPAVDEPLDYVIYLITVALGFAAFENALYICHPNPSFLCTGAPLQSLGTLHTDAIRFIGANLVHVVSSASIGFALAFSYRAKTLMRIGAVTLGVILAIALHTTFNFLIMDKAGAYVSDALLFVWMAIAVLFALFEILKYRTYKKLPPNVC